MHKSRPALTLLALATACASSPLESDDAAIHPVSEIRPYMKDGRNGRLDYLARARLFGEPMASLDPAAIERGQLYGTIAPGAKLVCSFETPGEELGGATPKFECRRGDEVFKVKFLPDLSNPASNRELYAEVAGSRLAWLLGLGADGVYPVDVECADCPEDPRHAVDEDWNPVRGYYGPGVIERKAPGPEIEASRSQRDVEGWRFRELDALAGLEGTDPIAARAPVDALRLFSALLQHWDCKPDNQRLACAPDGITTSGANPDEEDPTVLVDTETLQHCAAPVAFVHDLGDSFGHDARLFGLFAQKLDLDAWAGTRPLRQDDDGVCRLDLDPNLLCDGLGGETIGDAGRRFLVDRFRTIMTGPRGERDLSRLVAVFAAARVDRLGDSPTAWAEALAAKVDGLAAMQCTERPVLRNVVVPEGVEPGSVLPIALELHDGNGVGGAWFDVQIRRAGDDNRMRFEVASETSTRHGHAELGVAIPLDAWGPYTLTIVAHDHTGAASNMFTARLQIGWGQGE